MPWYWNNLHGKNKGACVHHKQKTIDLQTMSRHKWCYLFNFIIGKSLIKKEETGYITWMGIDILGA